jgi:hypothetical protein
MKSAVVHEYFKKELDGYLILLQVNPITFDGLELIIGPEGKREKTKRELDENIYEDLSEDGFITSSPLEFNLYLKGLK